MAKYAYNAITEDGKNVFGVLEAETEKDAISEVSRRGLFPTDVHKANITETLRAQFQKKIEEDRLLREREEARQIEERRKKHPRQKLVVRYADGRTEYGICLALNPKENRFHLECTDAAGVTQDRRVTVYFHELKAVYYVRSFDGKTHRSESAPPVETQGEEMVVEFKDGELLRGRLQHPYSARAERFYVVPSDPRSNNINVLVEASAVKEVLTLKEFQERRAEQRKDETSGNTPAVMTQEETMGDFYFESRDYESALGQYQRASELHGKTGRLHKKILASEYNIGVQFIKRRQYSKALEYMERILQQDPKNQYARKKRVQLKRILEKGKRPEAGEVEAGE